PRPRRRDLRPRQGLPDQHQAPQEVPPRRERSAGAPRLRPDRPHPPRPAVERTPPEPPALQRELHPRRPPRGRADRQRGPAGCVGSQDAVHAQQAAYIEAGYEGAIVRLLDAPYELGKRSNSLLKVKSFVDEEFKIISVTDGVGKFEGCAIIRVVTPEGKEFDVTPKGTMEERAEMYQQRESLIGQLLKVQFFEKSQDGIPRFPVGLGVRMPEDLDA